MLDLRSGIAIPATNGAAYQSLFAVEQWMRRLARIALAARTPQDTNSVLDSDLLKELKKRKVIAQTAGYLGIPAPADLVALTTIEELLSLLVSDALYPTVRRLSGYQRDVLSSKLEEVRQIRNAVGHNRMTSEKTCRILDSAVLSLEDGVEQIADLICSSPSAELAPDDPIQVHLAAALVARTDVVLPSEIVRVSATQDFYFFRVVPRHERLFAGGGIVSGEDPATEVRELGEWLDVRKLLAVIVPLAPPVVAIFLPRRATSFHIVWPRNIGMEKHQQVLDAAVAALDSVWGDEPLCEQDERFLASDLVWLERDLNGPAQLILQP